MTPLDPKQLTDPILEIEIKAAERWVARTSFDLRRSSRQTSEDGMHVLTSVAHHARVYEAALLDERFRRQQAGRYNPRTVVSMGSITVKPTAPIKAAIATASRKNVKRRFEDDDPERPPIIVFEAGFPRAWRKGDPIY
ncbi:MAG TPA: hypothetical protein VK629_05375 [Steroidobacteraceae bacterium]|nr:hypothetical protein [Steroidobacteraceae bacterium]